MLRSKSDDRVLRQIVGGAAKWVDVTMSAYDADFIDDWELDELLGWSTGLDFMITGKTGNLLLLVTCQTQLFVR